MLDSIYRVTLRFLLNLISDVKRLRLCHTQGCYRRHFIMLQENL